MTIATTDITPAQMEEMRHCLGLNYKKKPFRNYFYCSAVDANWNYLVDKGLAIKGGGWNTESAYYRLTFEAAKMVYGKPMSKKFYEELR